MARQPDDPEASDRLLFCPFCRECFEGPVTCPSHELALVEFGDLPKQAHERNVRWDEVVPPWEARFGRGIIAGGIAVLVIGFFLPLFTGSFDDQPIAWSGFELAMGRAQNLWTIPFVAVMFGYFLYRRRTLVQMLGSRLVAMMLAVMPLVSLGYSYIQVRRGVDELHGAVALGPGIGMWALGLACVLLLVGSYRFGRTRGDTDISNHRHDETTAESPIAKDK